MANTTYVSDKFFLDQSGLQALIVKIASLKEQLEQARKEVAEVLPTAEMAPEGVTPFTKGSTVRDAVDSLEAKDAELNGLLETLTGRLDEVIGFAAEDGSMALNELLDGEVIKQATADDNRTNGSILSQIVKYAKALRTELGALTDKTSDYTTVYAAIEDLLARAAKLEGYVAYTDEILSEKGTVADRLDTLESDAPDFFTQVKVRNYDPSKADDQHIYLDFFGKDQTVGDSYDPNTAKATAVIDASELIMHGILSDVHVVTMTEDDWNNGYVTVGKNGETITFDKNNFTGTPIGNPFLIFEFSVAHDETGDDHEYDGTHSDIKHIWVDVDNLFHDYDFEATKYGEGDVYKKYFTIEPTVDYAKDGSSRKVTLNVAAGATLEKIDALVLGAEGRGVAQIDADLATLEGYVGYDETEASKGTVSKRLGDAEDRLDTAEGEIDTIKEHLYSKDDDVNKPFTEGGATVADRLNDLEAWTYRVIPSTYVEDYWDWYFEGKTSTPPNVENYSVEP